jgi:extracellular elastinolytic metalloproteinase
VQVYPDSVTSVIEFQKDKSISVYPNPVKDEMFISVSDENIKTALIEITDITGKLVYSAEISIDNLIGRVDLNIENGVYLVKINCINNKKQSVQKIVINK